MAGAIFPEFPPISKVEWLARLEKDLKGKPWEDLLWHLEDDITIAPAYFPEDRPVDRSALGRTAQGSHWEIAESYEVEGDIAQANAQALEGLQGGVEAPLFLLKRHISEQQLEQLLNGINLDAISLNIAEFYAEKEPLKLLESFCRIANKRSSQPQALQGSIDFDPLLDWNEPPLDDLVRALHLVEAELPRFKILQINGRYYHAGPQEAARELGYTIAQGSEYLARLLEHGISPEHANRYLQFSVAVSSSYFVAIAKLRALRILWNNVLRGYGITNPAPTEIVVHLAKETQDENPNTNMIRATTQAMSAIIGGADRLYVLPANAALKEPSTSFSRRIARNVQHLLRFESHLHAVTDPAAGSYYIEQLTDALATKAWALFQELEEKGEFK
ncbi:MAG: hypothetical protein H6555_12015 [Lewinellaceae bacterium]|nr:hypothetical protein [Lewinellaceae bacterium]